MLRPRPRRQHRQTPSLPLINAADILCGLNDHVSCRPIIFRSNTLEKNALQRPWTYWLYTAPDLSTSQLHAISAKPWQMAAGSPGSSPPQLTGAAASGVPLSTIDTCAKWSGSCFSVGTVITLATYQVDSITHWEFSHAARLYKVGWGARLFVHLPASRTCHQAAPGWRCARWQHLF
jgi:hypothetical protein